MVRILQTDLGRARAAHDEAEITAYENQSDIIIISKPNEHFFVRFIREKNRDVAVKLIKKIIQIRKIKTGKGYVALEFGDWILNCGYYSPNKPLENFNTFFDKIALQVCANKSEIVIAGHYNAESRLWCSPLKDAREDYIEEWAASLVLVYINTGQTSAFLRGNKAEAILKEARKAPKKAMNQTKEACWETLCDDLDQDLWGQTYKIPIAPLGKLTPPHRLTTNKIVEYTRILFPEDPDERQQIMKPWATMRPPSSSFNVK
ncbi:hypothetical protein JTB14_000259 [Gonioctena quinquepunctata]|nr:hypothetical protein JTB14_000259 [Gonioctena quinquepunctata]